MRVYDNLQTVYKVEGFTEQQRAAILEQAAYHYESEMRGGQDGDEVMVALGRRDLTHAGIAEPFWIVSYIDGTFERSLVSARGFDSVSSVMMADTPFSPKHSKWEQERAKRAAAAPILTLDAIFGKYGGCYTGLRQFYDIFGHEVRLTRRTAMIAIRRAVPLGWLIGKAIAANEDRAARRRLRDEVRARLAVGVLAAVNEWCGFEGTREPVNNLCERLAGPEPYDFGNASDDIDPIIILHILRARREMENQNGLRRASIHTCAAGALQTLADVLGCEGGIEELVQYTNDAIMQIIPLLWSVKDEDGALGDLLHHYTDALLAILREVGVPTEG